MCDWPALGHLYSPAQEWTQCPVTAQTGRSSKEKWKGKRRCALGAGAAPRLSPVLQTASCGPCCLQVRAEHARLRRALALVTGERDLAVREKRQLRAKLENLEHVLKVGGRLRAPARSARADPSPGTHRQAGARGCFDGMKSDP